ncbi:UBX domain-containing protein 2A [Microtus ochrogaster]|uniref:UBX domain-containing protein 2A n=1 Tax=Microtus ochrogaster TaxID=79684 RepID=A0A8J6GAS0_MICOH|nr:UBX domain-containing protein 2A [Microtus ochrogaster]
MRVLWAEGGRRGLRSRVVPKEGLQMLLDGRGYSRAAAVALGEPQRTEDWALSRRKRMKEVDNLDSIKEKWICELGPPNNQPLNDNQQRDCEYFVDSLFEEAEKLGVKCLSPTEQKKQAEVIAKMVEKWIHSQ